MPTEQEIQDRLTRLETRVGLRTDANRLRPFEHEPQIPVVNSAQVLATFPEDGVTTVVVGWETPDNPDFETVELYVKDLSAGATGIVKVGEVREGPATLVLTADANTAKTIFLRTKMRNGLGSDLQASPTVTAQVNKLTVSGDSLEDGSVTTNKLANLAVTNAKIDNLAVTDAKIQSLSAAKITAGTLVAGVIYSGTINTNQINAGTVNGVNINGGTFNLVGGTNTMSITGGAGFRQFDTVTGTTSSIFNGNFSTFRTSNGNNMLIAGGTVFGGNSWGTLDLFRNGSLRLQASGGNNWGQVDLYENTGIIGMQLQAKGSQNLGDSLRIANSSGTTRITAGVTASGAQSNLTLSGSVQITLDTTTGNGLFIGGNRVVGPRLSSIATITDTADATYSANEVTMLNNLKTAVNALIDRIQTHGLTS